MELNLGNGDYIEMSIDLSNCSGTWENIISVGDSISNWHQEVAGWHLYYTAQTNTLQINSLVKTESNAIELTLSSTSVIIKFMQDQIFVDGVSRATNSAITSVSDFEIGSMEGYVRSNAVYNYIKVYRN